VSGCEHGNEFLDEVRTASFSLNCKDEGPRLSRDSPGYHKALQLSLILSPKLNNTSISVELIVWIGLLAQRVIVNM
jgi:hypothetical protein